MSNCGTLVIAIMYDFPATNGIYSVLHFHAILLQHTFLRTFLLRKGWLATLPLAIMCYNDVSLDYLPLVASWVGTPACFSLPVVCCCWWTLRLRTGVSGPPKPQININEPLLEGVNRVYEARCQYTRLTPNIHEYTILRGMNIRKSQTFWCYFDVHQEYRVLTRTQFFERKDI